MAFATNQYIDGEWTTRTVDVNDVLRHYNEQDAQQETPRVETVPVLGILSQTVLKSPLAHWILPVKARHFNLNDVAFIGVSDTYTNIPNQLLLYFFSFQASCNANCGANITMLRLSSLEKFVLNPFLNSKLPG